MELILKFCSLWLRHWPYQVCKWRLYKLGMSISTAENRVITAKSLNRKKYKVLSRDYAGSHLLVTGIWEPYVTKTLEKILQPGDVFLDIGANFGYFSILASSIVRKNGYVIAFECNPNILPLLKENIALNKCKNVNVYEHALGDQTGEISFFLSDTDSGQGSLDKDEGSEKINVKIFKYDDLDLKERIKLIKIDVEGAELRVLKGMEKLFSSGNRPYVICEISTKFNDRGGDDATSIFDFLSDFCYKPTFIPLNGSPYMPFDKLPEEYEFATIQKIKSSKHMRDVLFVPMGSK